MPSQDPDPAAQVGLSPAEAERESKSAVIEGGLLASLATGAAVGAAVAGPAGILVGGTVGAVAGAVGSKAAGELVNPESTVRPAKGTADTKNTHRSSTPDCPAKTGIL